MESNSRLSYEELGLDLIMNAKKAKKGGDVKACNLRLQKAFQIFEQRVTQNKHVSKNLDEFAEFLEVNIDTIIANFEKLMIHKSD